MAAVTLQVGGPEAYILTEAVEGGNAADLNAGFFYDPRFGESLRFTVRLLNEPHTKYELLVEGVKNTNVWHTRNAWEVECFVMHDTHARTIDRKHTYAKGKLTYNTSDKRGVLKILDHNQPPPAIEVIEWCQLIDRINKRKESVIETLYQNYGGLYRALIKNAEFWNDRFVIHTDGFRCQISGNEWEKLADTPSEIACPIPRSLRAPKPLAFDDGRILFEVYRKQKNPIMCTVYPSKKITWD